MKKLLFTIILISASVSLLAQNPTVIKDDLLLRGDSDTTPFGIYGKRLYFGMVSDNGWDPMWIGRFNVRLDEQSKLIEAQGKLIQELQNKK